MNKTKKIKPLITTLLYLAPFVGFANDTGKLKGKILDKTSNAPVEYATVSIFKKADSVLITGAISNDLGHFTIPKIAPGDYYIRINFLSYREYLISDVRINKASSMDLGTLFLEVDTQQLEEVVVTSESNNIDYQIDKKVIAVDKQLTSASMSAVEVLENVPSINVDIDGNVLLRGSSGFVVLVDGKPTALEPSDALRQIPASIILNIEIITNPSAKYIPDGTGGIINIITKQNRNAGINGLANARWGSFGTYGGDLLVNYRKGKSNFYVGGDLNMRVNPGTERNERRTTRNDTITTLISEGSNTFRRGGWSVRGGWDWDITKKNILSLQARIGSFGLGRTSNLRYATTQNLPDAVREERTKSGWGVDVGFINITGNYTHKFLKEKEELSLQVNFRAGNPDEKSDNFLFNSNGDNILKGSGMTESGPFSRWNLRLDYTKPFDKGYTLEVGSQIRLGKSRDETAIYDFDDTKNALVEDPDKRNKIDYKRDIYGVYAVFRGTLNSLGYQMGIRSEYTNRKVNSTAAQSSTTVDRIDFFPSVHLSYDLSPKAQVMMSYSRRIDRPRSWYFEPFIIWTDLFNVRQGNPGLLPEYIDAFEASYIKRWKKVRLSLETYYRITNNRINTIRSDYRKDVVLSAFENVGTDYTLGLEGVLNIKWIKWWEINITGNTYNYEVRGNIDGNSFDNESFNWSARVSNIFKIHKNVRLQVDGRYNSPTATAQGEESAYYMFNLGLRVDALDKKLSASLQVRDVFATARKGSLVESATLYSYRSNLANAPRFAINLSYRLNNYQQKRKRNSENDGDDF